MLASDVVVAEEDCRLPTWKWAVASCRLAERRCAWLSARGNAHRYLLTGEEYGAAEAYRRGLVQGVVSVGQAQDRAIALAEMIARQAPLAVQASLASSRRYVLDGFEVAALELSATQVALIATGDAQEGK